MTSNCLITEGSVPSSAESATRGEKHEANVRSTILSGWWFWTSLKNMKVNGKDDPIFLMENKICSKPPTRYGSYTVYTVSVTYVKSHWSWKFRCFPSGDHYVKHCFKMTNTFPTGWLFPISCRPSQSWFAAHVAHPKPIYSTSSGSSTKSRKTYLVSR